MLYSAGRPVIAFALRQYFTEIRVTGAPRVVKGKVLIGNGGAEFGVRGYITAYNADTGKQAWRFYTVPGDPSKPVESPALEKAIKTWTGRPCHTWGA